MFADTSSTLTVDLTSYTRVRTPHLQKGPNRPVLSLPGCHLYYRTRRRLDIIASKAEMRPAFDLP